MERRESLDREGDDVDVASRADSRRQKRKECATRDIVVSEEEGVGQVLLPSEAGGPVRVAVSADGLPPAVWDGITARCVFDLGDSQALLFR